MKKLQAAFTLLEVLIALAMLAIVMTAAFRGINLVAAQTSELGERHMAQWIAQNRLAEMRMGSYPDLGTTDGVAEQGGYKFRWHEKISRMDQPLFRRIDVTVMNSDGMQLAALIGIASSQ